MNIVFNDLEADQQEAYLLARDKETNLIRIVGYAGTGKTFLMAALANDLGGACEVLAPTNKAALNLKERGIKKARTIHSYLYVPAKKDIYQTDQEGNIEYQLNADGTVLKDERGEPVPVVIGEELVFGLKEVEDTPPIALVDEASMVEQGTLEDLLNVFDKVILFGDGFQLPPVAKGAKSSLDLGEPDVLLTKVHRVAEGNPITMYATAIRNHKEPTINDVVTEREIRTCGWGNSHLYNSIVKNDVQCISYRNKTRHVVNDKVRAAKGYEPNTLMKGEQIVCNQNVREVIDNGYGETQRVLKFFNGQIMTVAEDYTATDDNFTAVMVRMYDELGKEHYQRLWPFWNKDFFLIKDNFREWNAEINRRKHASNARVVFGADFDYSYCLTAHKAQGSEFKNVCVFDERPSIRISPMEKQKWYYTAITRAKERLLVVK